MKRLLILATFVAFVTGAHQIASAQADAGLVSKFLSSAKSSSDGQLGVIGSELVAKVQALAKTPAVKGKLDDVLKRLTGGKDSAALGSAFDLVKEAKLTPEQLGIAKEVGNLASAYVMQKNFAALEGSQSDVSTIVKSLREGRLAATVPPLKKVASNAHLTDGQKKLIKTVADKYAPGLEKAKGAMDAIKKFPGLGK